MSDEVNFDLKRMRKSVVGPFLKMPDDLTREQLREWMRSHSKSPKAKR